MNPLLFLVIFPVLGALVAFILVRFEKNEAKLEKAREEQEGLDFTKYVRLAKDDPRVLRIKKAARLGTLEYASTDKVDSIEPWVKVVLDGLGVEAIFISDESKINDFAPLGSTAEFYAKVSQNLGLEITSADYVYDVAWKLRERYNAEKLPLS